MPVTCILHIKSVKIWDSCKYKTQQINKTCVCEHGCPRQEQSYNMAKISKSYILTPPHPQGHGMSVKCEQSIDGLTVQIWLLYHHTNFTATIALCLKAGRNYRQTDRQTNRWRDRWRIRLLDAPSGSLRPGHKNSIPILKSPCNLNYQKLTVLSKVNGSCRSMTCYCHKLS